MRDVSRPILNFYGAKWRMARHFPRPEGIVVEPFAGSAGYSVWWGVEQVLLIERDPKIAAVWDYLLHSTREEIMALPLLHEGEKISDLHITQEAKWFLGFWCNAGASSPCNTLSKWSLIHLRQNHSGIWCARKREQVANQLDRMKDWHIVCGSYEVASAITHRATWFIDPPYQGAGKHYQFSVIDYEALAEFARTRVGLTIVCENEGASWLPFKPFGNFAGTPGQYRTGRTKEVVWVNQT